MARPKLPKLIDFYPRSPCGERLMFTGVLAHHTHFYPRSPCGERLIRKSISVMVISFLSTLSLRRATHTGGFDDLPPFISIHALLAESDASNFKHTEPSGFLSTLSLRRATLLYAMGYYRHGNFYPRSPCGERRSVQVSGVPSNVFLSTLSLRRATTVAGSCRNGVIGFLSTLSLRRATGHPSHIPWR